MLSRLPFRTLVDRNLLIFSRTRAREFRNSVITLEFLRVLKILRLTALPGPKAGVPVSFGYNTFSPVPLLAITRANNEVPKLPERRSLGDELVKFRGFLWETSAPSRRRYDKGDTVQYLAQCRNAISHGNFNSRDRASSSKVISRTIHALSSLANCSLSHFHN